MFMNFCQGVFLDIFVISPESELSFWKNIMICHHYRYQDTTLYLLKKQFQKFRQREGAILAKIKLLDLLLVWKYEADFFFEKDSTKLKASFFFDVHRWQMK